MFNTGETGGLPDVREGSAGSVHPISYMLSWSHHFESFTVAAIMTWLTAMEFLCHKWPLIHDLSPGL
jgi:hypothetical protein